MPPSDLPTMVRQSIEKYLSSSEYERRYSEDFRDLDAERQLLVVLIDLYPEELEPADIADYTDCTVGSIYPHLRKLEQDEIVARSGGQYRLAWRRPTEEKIEELF